MKSTITLVALTTTLLACGESSINGTQDKEDSLLNAAYKRATVQDSVYKAAVLYIDKADSVIKLSIQGGLNNKKADKLASSYLDSAKSLRKLLSPEDDALISEKIKANGEKAIEYMMEKQAKESH
jgi:hypothetical protein